MTSILEITRIAMLTAQGVFGVMKMDNHPFCVTLEPPDNGNERQISCIPSGQYVCHKFNSSKYGRTWEICNVPNRSAILFHSGNVVTHTKGCILLAQHYGKLKGDLAVLNSGDTFKQFLRLTETCSELQLTIREGY